jgi:hypothetical protein
MVAELAEQANSKKQGGIRDLSRRFVRNVGILLQDYTVSHPTRQYLQAHGVLCTGTLVSVIVSFYGLYMLNIVIVMWWRR